MEEVEHVDVVVVVVDVADDKLCRS